MDAAGKTIIVTGAGSGIGRASARVFAEAGMKVVLCGRRMSLLEEAKQEIAEAGGQAVAVAVDVTDRASADEMVRRAIEAFGQIDVLFNNAGSFRHVGPTWEAAPALLNVMRLSR